MTAYKYQIVAIEPNGGTVTAVFDGPSFYELKYSRALNDVGVVAFTIPGTAANRNAFQLDSFIEVYRTNPLIPSQLLLEDTYLVRLFQRFREGQEEKYLVAGYSLNHLLKRRVVDPNEDITATDGYSRKSGAADIIISAYVNQQAGPSASASRQVPGLSIAPQAGQGVSISWACRYDILYDALFQMTIPGQVDFIITRNGNANTLFTAAPIGSDKSFTSNSPIRPFVGLVPNRGNLRDPNFIIDRQDERTVMLALGQGQGLQRAVATITAKGIVDSPFNRWETTIDSNQILKSDTLGLGAVGVSALYPYAPKRSFTCALNGDEGGLVYRSDWDVGDTVTAIWDNLQADLRIWGVTVSVSSQGQELAPDLRVSQIGNV